MATDISFCQRAILGLIVSGCIIGGHVIQIVLGEYYEWILKNETNCMYNSTINADHTWIIALDYFAFIGIGFAVIFYGFILLGYLELIICTGTCWALVYVTANFIGDCLGGTYIRSYYDNNNDSNEIKLGPDCDTQYFNEIFGMVLTANILPIIGLICLCFYCVKFKSCLAPIDDPHTTHQPLPTSEIEAEQIENELIINEIEENKTDQVINNNNNGYCDSFKSFLRRDNNESNEPITENEDDAKQIDVPQETIDDENKNEDVINDQVKNDDDVYCGPCKSLFKGNDINTEEAKMNEENQQHVDQVVIDEVVVNEETS